MDDEPKLDLETDPRFPSGRWVGFFVDRRVPGKHQMELHLTFRQGGVRGEGRDFVGKFALRGQYSTTDGKCHWHKRYVGRHDVFYLGFNEGKGIWGTWELVPKEVHGLVRGGFHIWPEGMGDPTELRLEEAADIPVEERELIEAGK